MAAAYIEHSVSLHRLRKPVSIRQTLRAARGQKVIATTNTFNYAAPVIALFLSALPLHEPLTLVKLISGGIALVGVALMIDRK